MKILSKVPGSDEKRSKKSPSQSCHIKLIAKREVSSGCRLRNKHLQQKGLFDKFHIIQELDLFDKATDRWCYQFERPRSEVSEIIIAENFLIAVSANGLCSVFDRDSGVHKCYLNSSPSESIRSVFYNRINSSLIIISTSINSACTLSCRCILLQHVESKHLDRSFSLFQSEHFVWPGFIEFDDINGKIITRSSAPGSHKVWNMQTYELLYPIGETQLEEIRISSGVMLLLCKSRNGELPVTLININDGSVIATRRQRLKENTPIEFVEQFNEYMLFKQQNEDMLIANMKHPEKDVIVPCDQFTTPQGFIFLYDSYKFVSITKDKVEVWNFKGEKVNHYLPVLPDPMLSKSDYMPPNFFVNKRQEVLLAYNSVQLYETVGRNTRRSSVRLTRKNKPAGQVEILDLVSGKTIAVIDSKAAKKTASGIKISTPVDDSLNNVCSLVFDEVRHELYLGDTSGHIFKWGAGK